MAGHGGARPFAGAPRGGISETRRLLLRGLKRGLSIAGRAKGLEGSDDEVAVESVARIASDLILAGQGRDVLAIFAQASAKGDGADDPENASPLQRALNRLPGLKNGTDVSREGLEQPAIAADSRENATRPTDAGSVEHQNQPFFAPQRILLPPDMDPTPPPVRTPAAELLPPGARGILDGARAPGGAGAGDPPTPHPATPPPRTPLDAEIFEKIRGAAPDSSEEGA